MLESTVDLYSFMPPAINQSERDYSVRHGVYVRCLTNQSAAIAYVTGHTYAVLTNQSAAIAYVTGCTYAVRPISARRSRILISVAQLAQHRAASHNLTQPQKRGSKTSYYTTFKNSFIVHNSYRYYK